MDVYIYINIDIVKTPALHNILNIYHFYLVVKYFTHHNKSGIVI